MIVLEQKLLMFNVKWVYFSDYPIDINDCDIANFVYCKSTENFEGFSREKQLTAITDLTQDIEAIWGKIHKKTRRHIRQAEESNICIEINNNYDEFYKMNIDVQKRKGFYSFLDNQHPKVDVIKKHCTLFTAKYKGNLVAGNICLEDTDNIRLLVRASRRFEVDKDIASLIGHVNRLLTWETVKYAKSKGLKQYEWGGLWPEEEAAQDINKQNINLYKLSFGGERVVRYCYRKIYSPILRLAKDAHIGEILKILLKI